MFLFFPPLLRKELQQPPFPPLSSFFSFFFFAFSFLCMVSKCAGHLMAFRAVKEEKRKEEKRIRAPNCSVRGWWREGRRLWALPSSSASSAKPPSGREMIYGALFITGHGHFSGMQLAGTPSCGSCTPRLSLSFFLSLSSSLAPSLKQDRSRVALSDMPFWGFFFLVFCMYLNDNGSYCSCTSDWLNSLTLEIHAGFGGLQITLCLVSFCAQCWISLCAFIFLSEEMCAWISDLRVSLQLLF